MKSRQQFQLRYKQRNSRFAFRQGEMAFGIISHFHFDETGGNFMHNEKEDAFPEPIPTHEAQPAVNIILADDDSDDRELFKEALDSDLTNIQLECAEDGKELLEMLLDGKRIPDLLFLDLNMPHTSGIECLCAIRKSAQWKDIPIIIYSTSSSQKDIEDTYQNGANLYIIKPTDFKELKNMVSIVLGLDWNMQTPHGPRHQFVFSSKTGK